MQSRIYFGNSGGSSESKITFELITLDANDILTNTLTLSQVPSSISKMMAWVINGSTFTPTIDFVISGNTVDFSASPYVGTLSEGDKIQFIFERV